MMESSNKELKSREREQNKKPSREEEYSGGAPANDKKKKKRMNEEETFKSRKGNQNERYEIEQDRNS